MKNFIFIISILVFIFIASPAFACQPCPTNLNLKQTVNKSDLIIVGQKISDGPRSDFSEGYGGPDWINVKIIETLKGSATSAIIKVNSWEAMCAYGIIVNDDRNYLMLLQNINDIEENLYDAVDYGCAEKSYLVENNQINLYGQKISLEDFASNYGLSIKTVQVKNLNPYYYIISAFLILVIIIYTLAKKAGKI